MHRAFALVAIVLASIVGCADPKGHCAEVPVALLASQAPAVSASSAPAPSSSTVAAVPFDLTAGNSAPPPLALPEATQDVEPVSAVAMVDLAGDGSWSFNGRKLSNPDQLLATAKQAQEADPNVRAVIRADRSAPWGEVVRAMDLLKQAGIERLAFAVDGP